MPTPSIFFGDWRAYLRARTIDVIRTGDSITEPSLRAVRRQDEAWAPGPLAGEGETEADSPAVDPSFPPQSALHVPRTAML